MPRYFFPVCTLTDSMQTKDSQGHEFANGKEACTHAVKRMPAALRKYAHSTGRGKSYAGFLRSSLGQTLGP